MSNFDDHNNDSNNTPPAAPAAPPDQPPVVDQTAKIADLESQLAELRAQLDGSRLETAVAKAKNPQGVKIDSGAQEARRQKAIASVGGNAKWHALPVAERVKIVNDGTFVNAPQEEVDRYFGPKSDAREAQRLAATDPQRYKALRAQWIERGK